MPEIQPTTELPDIAAVLGFIRVKCVADVIGIPAWVLAALPQAEFCAIEDALRA